MNEIIATANNNDYLSKNELLVWINDLLKLNINKIEILGTGAIHCQLLDVLYPGKVPMNKVNWRAKFEYEFVANFKILQQSFTKLNIMKPIEIEKLIKCKTQDNLEFCQWVKKFFDANYTQKEYDPVARRGSTEVDFSFLDKIKGSSKEGGTPLPGVGSNKPSLMKQNSTRQCIPIPKSYQLSVPATASQTQNLSKNSSTSNLSSLCKENESGVKEAQPLNEKSPHFEAIKTERDFYFNKLRDIDHLLDVYRDSNVETLQNKIREIMYSPPEKIVLIFEDGNIKVQDNKMSEEQDSRDNLENLLSDKMNPEDIFNEEVDPLKEIQNMSPGDLSIPENLKKEILKEQQENLLNLENTEENLLLE